MSRRARTRRDKRAPQPDFDGGYPLPWRGIGQRLESAGCVILTLTRPLPSGFDVAQDASRAKMATVRSSRVGFLPSDTGMT